MSFPYERADIEAVRRSLSADRFGRYLAATHGDEVAAVQLYAWNTAISGAFYGPLQACEVSLRNAVNDALSAAYGAR